MKIKTFFSDGLSLDESRVSLLMIAFTIGFGVLVYSYFSQGDSPSNFSDVVMHIGTLIVGANIAKPIIDSVIKSNNSEK